MICDFDLFYGIEIDLNGIKIIKIFGIFVIDIINNINTKWNLFLFI